MDVKAETLEDDAMLAWAKSSIEEWQRTGDHRHLEEPWRYTERLVHAKKSAGERVPVQWLVISSSFLIAQWRNDSSDMDSFERAVSISATIIQDYGLEDETISTGSKIALGEIFVGQFRNKPDDEQWLTKGIALLQDCTRLPLNSPESPAQKALRLLDFVTEQWPQKTLRVLSEVGHDHGIDLLISEGFTVRLTRDFSWLEKISDALHRGYRNHDNLPSLRRAIVRLSQYETLVGADDADQGSLSARLADMCCALWRATRDSMDLAAALTAVKRALTLTSKGSQDRFLSNVCLGIVAHEWFLQTDSQEERDDILVRCKSALTETPKEKAVVNVWYTTILKMLRMKYSDTKNLDALREAVDFGRMAFDDYARKSLIVPARNDSSVTTEGAINSGSTIIIPDSELPDRSGDLSFFLGSLLHDLYRETLDISLLKEAGVFSELAFSNSQSSDSTEIYSHQRFHTLILLYEMTNLRDYLDDAKHLVRSRLAHFGALPDRRKWLFFLAEALNEEHQHSLERGPLDESIQIYREALEIEVPDNVEFLEETATLRHGLADALFRRNDLTVQEDDKSVSDIDEALEIVNTELESLQLGESWAMGLEQMAIGLRGQIYLSRFQRAGLGSDLDSAIRDLKVVKSCMDIESIDQNEVSYSLGVAFLESDREDDLRQGESYLLEIGHAKSANLGTRLLAAVVLSRFYAERKAWQDANTMMENAMDLIPLIQNPLLVVRDLAATARRYSNLVGEAFALALQAGKGAQKAIERLEINRGSILTHLLNQDEDITELKVHYKQDADRFLELRDILKQRRDRLPLSGMQVETEVESIKKFDKAVVEMQELLQNIRNTRPGFERFLLGPDQDQLCRAVSSGYIVIVNMTRLRSDAVIISSSGLQSVELPSLVFNDAARWLKLDLTEYERPQFGKKNAEFRRFLTWLWTVCVRDILSEVSKQHKPGEMPRVWWMGIGLCAYFPFHAAGIHDGVSLEYAMASVVSSYIPTLRSFLNAQRQSARRDIPTDEPSLLMAQMQSTPGMNNLPGAAEEEAIIKRYRGSGIRFHSISQCTSDAVLDAMEAYDIVHFACHGVSNSREGGLDSSLVFQKKAARTCELVQDKLYVQRIYDKKLKRARLAYLSACSTAHVADVRLIDEGLHLVSSFMIAGFTHVIGTFWMTLDDVCVQMTECFYRNYLSLKASEGGSDGVALALHRAAIEIRNRHPKQPLGWAPFVHYGI